MTPDIAAATAGVLVAMLGDTPDFAVVVTTPDGTIEGWMGAAERLFGHRAADVVGESLSILFTPHDRALGLDAHEIAVAKTVGRTEDDRWHVRRDGSRFWASGVLTAVRGEAGEIVALCKVLRDKTDVVTQLQRLQNQLEAGDRFLRSTAHELRNPLMPIASALSLLQRDDAAHLRAQALKVLDSQVRVLTRLVEDLNGGQRSEEAPPLACEPLNLNAALQTVVDGVAETAAARGQDLALLLPPAEIRILADPTRLQQMLLNLLGNAVKYTPAGGRICVSVSVEADMSVIRVEDDGIGISAEMLPTIFELFTREDRSSPIPGAGVGLAVVKRLASLHGGSVDVRSPGRGKGSAFGLRLPMFVARTAPGAPATDDAPGSAVPLPDEVLGARPPGATPPSADGADPTGRTA